MASESASAMLRRDKTLALLLTSATWLHNSHFASIMAQRAKFVHSTVARILVMRRARKH
jgi:hypothetical protein